MANILLRDISEEDREALKKLAKLNKRSLNSELLVALEKYIKENEKEV